MRHTLSWLMFKPVITLSVYVKADFTSTGGTGSWISLKSTRGGSDVAASTKVTADQGWTRLELTYTHPSSASAANLIAYLQSDRPGYTWFDCVQFEEAPSASRYNLIENSDFRFGDSSTEVGAYQWTMYDSIDSSGRIWTVPHSGQPQLDSNVYRFIAFPDAYKFIYQDVYVPNGANGDVFTLAGWALADSVPLSSGTSRTFGLTARFFDASGNKIGSDQTVNFNPDTDTANNWQYAARQLIAPGNYAFIRIFIEYEFNDNAAYFDGIQLYKEQFGHSYTYDSDGNVTSVVDLQKKTTTYEYASNNLTKMTLPSGATQTYTYDSHHNVTKAVSPEGVTSNFAYDTYGNNTSVSLGSGAQKITATAAYTADGNQLASVTDALNQTTYYGYNLKTGVLEWTQAPGETSATRTSNTYDNMYRTTQVSKSPAGAAAASVNYAYSDDLLSTISTAGGTNYSFTYGVFDQIASVKVGSRTLISHTYTNDANRRLARSDYGNGDYVTYTYDSYGRVTGTGYEDGTSTTTQYDNNGNVGVVTGNGRR
ncbi:MAG: RHS repeat protein, partial [Clostridiales bacterium]|nr:RHS repeat protein [Clostridiales bacterium]